MIKLNIQIKKRFKNLSFLERVRFIIIFRNEEPTLLNPLFFKEVVYFFDLFSNSSKVDGIYSLSSTLYSTLFFHANMFKSSHGNISPPFTWYRLYSIPLKTILLIFSSLILFFIKTWSSSNSSKFANSFTNFLAFDL